MKNLIEYIYNNPHSNRVQIKFDDQFGEEDTVLKFIKKLIQQNLVYKVSENYFNVILEYNPRHTCRASTLFLIYLL